MTPRSILIVEDEALVAADLRSCVSRMGYDVAATVDEGEEAIRVTEAARPDLALMDIRLKGRMDGVEAARELRRRFDVPVVFLTSHADDDTLDRAGGAEPFGYLVKPFNDRELEATIATALRRYEAESRVVRMERWLDATLRSIGDGVIATDVRGAVTYMNTAAERLCAHTFRESVTRPFGSVFPRSPGDPPDDLVGRLLADPASDVSDEVSIPTPSGEPIPVERTATAIRSREGDVNGAVVVFRDISQRLRADAHAREVQRLESLGVLAGGIAHDFNNILVGVLGYAQLAKPELPEDSTVQPYLELIEQAAVRAADLCSQLQAYAGQARLVVRSVLVSDVLHAVRELASERAPAEVELTVEADPGTPSITGDESQLRRVVASLVTNALEAIPAGRPGRVVLRCRGVRLEDEQLEVQRLGAELASGSHVCIEVQDDGIGMDEETRSRVFEPFYSTKFVGRGLGLAAVLGVVRRHDGAIRVLSAPGQGTTVRVLIPSAAPAPAVTTKAEPVGTVLVVDDQEIVARPTAQMLRRLGYEVAVASTVDEALKAARERTFSLVLLDLTMPGPGPAEVVRRMRQATPDLPVVIMSGYPEEGVLGRLGDVRIQGFLQKPFAHDALRGVVSGALEG